VPIKLNWGIKTAGNKTADKIKDGIVIFRARYGRGWGLVGDYVKQPVIALTAIAWWSSWLFENYGFKIPVWMLYTFVPFWFAFWYGLGWFDQFKIKLWQREALWTPKNISPWEIEKMKRIKNIERRVKKLENGNKR